tara:strand:- start:2425 stop:2943 length:519 start_codon:yes stop_codon:yes gene_type:complete
MAHFAKLDSNNIVLAVEVVDNSWLLDENNEEQESLGVQRLQQIHGWALWKKTSYNTSEGKYFNSETMNEGDSSKAFRKNFAGIGYKYDEARDAFIPPKQYSSWVLNETTCVYEAPTPMPTFEQLTYTFEGNEYRYAFDWNEENLRWEGFTSHPNHEGDAYYWDSSSSSWVAI